MMLWTFFTNRKAVKLQNKLSILNNFLSSILADSWSSLFYLLLLVPEFPNITSVCVFPSSLLHSQAYCCAWSKLCLSPQPQCSCLAPASCLGLWAWWSVSTFWLPSSAAREWRGTARLCLQPGGFRGLAAGTKSWDAVAVLGGGCAGE